MNEHGIYNNYGSNFKLLTIELSFENFVTRKINYPC